MKKMFTTLSLMLAMLLLSSTDSLSFSCLGGWNKISWTGGCIGTLTQDDGAKYIGSFKWGKYHGQGTMTYANGNKYVGEWKENKYHGQGTYTEADGTQYVGEWKDDEFVKAMKIPQRAKTKLDTSNLVDVPTKEQMKIIKDKISKCMFKNVKKVTNALQYSIIQKECKRQATVN